MIGDVGLATELSKETEAARVALPPTSAADWKLGRPSDVGHYRSLGSFENVRAQAAISAGDVGARFQFGT